MKCQHDNEITVLVELYADSFESFTISRYNTEGQEYNPFVSEDLELLNKRFQFQWLLVKGCPQCKTIRFEGV